MYVIRLGNRVLLQASRNSNLKNAGFQDKNLYVESPHRLTSMIAEVGDWTPNEIAKPAAGSRAVGARRMADVIPSHDYDC